VGGGWWGDWLDQLPRADKSKKDWEIQGGDEKLRKKNATRNQRVVGGGKRLIRGARVSECLEVLEKEKS